MGRSLVAVLAACLALMAPAEAAELEGFGKIKFGMTKDEAWKAIAGEGEWAEGDILRYSYLFNAGSREEQFVVRQKFTNGQASHAEIEHFTAGVTPEICSWFGIRFADLIRHKYGVMPAVNYGVPHMTRPGNRESYILVDSFQFYYEEQGTINIISTLYYTTQICIVRLRYDSAKFG